MVRATHGVHNGAYYWEIEILPHRSPNAAVRIGWSQRQGELQGPVGYDKFSFGYRDIGGSKVHNSVRNDAYGEAYGPGDVVGSYLYVDADVPENNQLRFFKNGKDQGIAYRGAEISRGVYFPAVSLYMLADVRVNFGPSFILRFMTR